MVGLAVAMVGLAVAFVGLAVAMVNLAVVLKCMCRDGTVEMELLDRTERLFSGAGMTNSSSLSNQYN